jgi:hypothetical protein
LRPLLKMCCDIVKGTAAAVPLTKPEASIENAS